MFEAFVEHLREICLQKNLRGFTLLEIVIVMLVMGIVMTITLNLGRWYTQRVRFQQEKEQFIASFTRFTTYARTSNLAGDAPYTQLTIKLSTHDSIATTNTNVQIGTYHMAQSQLVLPWETYTLALKPYDIWCSLIENPSMQEVSFEQVSGVGEWKACYALVLSTCKIEERPCQ